MHKVYFILYINLLLLGQEIGTIAVAEAVVPDLGTGVEVDLAVAAMAAAAVDLEVPVVLVAKRNSPGARTCGVRTGVRCPCNHSIKTSIIHTRQC